MNLPKPPFGLSLCGFGDLGAAVLGGGGRLGGCDFPETEGGRIGGRVETNFTLMGSALTLKNSPLLTPTSICILASFYTRTDGTQMTVYNDL